MMIKGLLVLSVLIAVSCANSVRFQAKDFTNLLTSCKTVQSNLAFFAGSCYLQLDPLAGNLDKIKAYVLAQSPDSNVETLLNNGFKNSTQYFQITYPTYNTEYKDFENRIIAIMNKIKPSTEKALMSDFKAAILDSKMNEVYNKILAGTFQSCGQDSTVCEKTNQMLNLNPNTLGAQTVDEFLTESFTNILKFFEKNYNNQDLFGEDMQTVDAMLQGLKLKGTSGTMVKLVQGFFSSQLFTNIRNTYDPKYTTALPIKTRSTTPRTTKPTKETVTKTPIPQFVDMAVYLTVPLVILFLGIVSTALIIIFYYRMVPHVGGKKTKVATDSGDVITKQAKF